MPEDADRSSPNSRLAGNRSLNYANAMRRRRKRFPWRLLWLLVVPLVFLLDVRFWGRGRVYVEYNRVASMSHLREIGQALWLYDNEFHQGYPPMLLSLVDKEYLPANLLVSPADTSHAAAQGATTQAVIDDFLRGGHCSYAYLGAGMDPKVLPDVVICYEPLAVNNGAGMNVLFGDGHVQWLDAGDGKAIEAAVFSGVRPVRWPVPVK
jgi:prepilin-type processing-associated H-X9-DG protein